jgi:hypothetical protein
LTAALCFNDEPLTEFSEAGRNFKVAATVVSSAFDNDLINLAKGNVRQACAERGFGLPKQ